MLLSAAGAHRDIFPLSTAQHGAKDYLGLELFFLLSVCPLQYLNHQSRPVRIFGNGSQDMFSPFRVVGRFPHRGKVRPYMIGCLFYRFIRPFATWDSESGTAGGKHDGASQMFRAPGAYGRGAKTSRDLFEIQL